MAGYRYVFWKRPLSKGSVIAGPAFAQLGLAFNCNYEDDTPVVQLHSSEDVV